MTEVSEKTNFYYCLCCRKKAKNGVIKEEKIDLTGMKIPEHVAIILDGNGRWAKKRFMPRNAGHAAGARNVEKIIEDET